VTKGRDVNFIKFTTHRIKRDMKNIIDTHLCHNSLFILTDCPNEIYFAAYGLLYVSQINNDEVPRQISD
jgi:hypothetical protein